MSKPATFGERLREIRKSRNLTQRDLAEKVAARLKADDRRGFDFTYLSKIENDKTPPPSVAAILQLARILETDADELIALAGKVPPEFGETLKGSEAARIFYRSALNAALTEEDWKSLLHELIQRTKVRGDYKKPGN
ncbi:helix-turn-helix domain-containing protein [bacterium]|nr:helix-turn-helix domain-containing protein [bacterium]